MARVQREREVKLACPPGFVLPPLGEPRAVVLTATYYDTTDLRLARWGVTLRRRDDGWTLKLPDRGARLEVTLPLSVGTRVPAELRRLVTAYARGAPLRRVSTVVTRRTAVRVGDVEVVHDEVTAGASSWSELEVEALTDDADLRPCLKLLRTAGAQKAAQTPKAVRALGPEAALPPDPPPAEPMRRRDQARLLVEHALRTQTRALVLQDSRVRLELDDAVHQVRVAARRLRSALRTLRPLVAPDWGAEIRAELAWVGGAMGAARDAEVGLLLVTWALERVGAEADVHALVAGAYRTHAGSELAPLSSPRWVRLLDQLVTACSAPPVLERAATPIRKVAPDLVGRTWRQLAAAADRLEPGRSTETDYHQVRVLAKRARYAVETVAPAYGRPARDLVARLTAVQDALGEHQDCVVAGAVLRRLAADAPPAQAFVLGQTCEVLAARGRGQRVAFHALWPDVRRARHRRWLEG